MKKVKLKKPVKYVFIASCIIIALAIIINTKVISSLAIYVGNFLNKYTQKVKSFELASDYLKESAVTYDIYQTPISINLSNIENTNVSEVNVDFNVSVTNGTSNYATGTLTGGTLDSETLIITPNSGATYVTVSITTTPYNKPLSATFNIKETGTNSNYSFTDQGSYSILTLRTGANPGNIIINYGSHFDPDKVNSLTTAWADGTSGTLTNLSANTIYKIIFYELVTGSYTTSDSLVATNGTITLP